MPADQPNIGMGNRRQGYTGPERPDDSNRSLDRSIGEGQVDGNDEQYEGGKVAGASGADTPHRPIKPGTRIDLDDAGLGGDSTK
jgi:hypothetical protein